MVKELERLLKNKDGISWDSGKHHIPCLTNILNLTIKAFLNTLNRHRTSLRKSARYEALTRSTGALARIFDQAEEDYSDETEQEEAEIEALNASGILLATLEQAR